MSNIAVVMDGGGKYRVQVGKVDNGGTTQYAVRIILTDWGASTTLMFDTIEQASGFVSDMTQAILACASKVND